MSNLTAHTGVIVVRVSTKGQEEKGYSIQEQIEYCKHYAQENNIYVPDDYILVDVVSGRTLQRDALEQARAILHNGKAKHLIVTKLDRANRNVSDNLTLAAELKGLGVDFHYAKSNRKHGDIKIMDYMEAIFAEMEAERIRGRLKDGRTRKARDGNYMGNGLAPYGYEKIDTYNGKRKITTLKIIESEAEIVRMIFQWFVIGENGSGPIGVKGIRTKLTQLAIPTPSDRQSRINYNKLRKHADWSASAIYYILDNSIYAGTFKTFQQEVSKSTKTGGKVTKRRTEDETIPVDVPAIIEKKLFDAAQEIRKHNRETIKRAPKHDYLMRCQLKCACGYSMIGKSKHSKGHVYLYYKCNGTDPVNTARRCTMPLIHATKVDELIWSWVQQTVLDEDKLVDRLQAQVKYNEQQQENIKQQIKLLTETRADIEMQRDTLLKQLARRAIDEDRFDRVDAELAAQSEKIANEIKDYESKLTATFSADDATVIRLLSRTIKRGTNKATYAAKRHAIETLQVKGKITQIGPKQYEIEVSSVLDTDRLSLNFGIF